MDADQSLTCARCKITKPAADFYFRRTEEQHHCYCKQCHNAYTHERFKRRKLDALTYLGDTCADCGGASHYSVFESHHLDPSRKDLQGSQLKRWSWARVREELDKCVLLCANCHRMRHWASQPTA